MAEAVAPGGQDARHGRKRPADSSLESEQRLSKRFDLLNIVDNNNNNNNGTRLYLPVAGSSDPAAARLANPAPVPLAPVTKKKRERAPRPPPPEDCMHVEDTPHRVYIHDLAAELSDIESDEENPIFLADIEKHIAKIPRHILMGPAPKPTTDNQQLVLYNIPSSLTVPEEQDNVRKAIVEARARVRERQANPTAEPERVNAVNATNAGTPVLAEDPDAMDID